MEIIVKDKNKALKILSIILIILLFLYILIMSYNYYLLIKYKNKMYNNTYINNYNISNMKIDKIYKKLDEIEKKELNKKITFVAKDKKYQYIVKDLGIEFNKEAVKEQITNYHKTDDLYKKLKKIVNKEKTIFLFTSSYSKNNIRKIIEGLKSKIDVVGHDGRLTMDNNRNLIYDAAVTSYDLDVDKSYEKLIQYIDSGFIGDKVDLVVNVNDYKESEDLKLINTKVSTFSSKYNAYISRGRNLENALRNIDGTIVKSGEVFSYFNEAGPYNKAGYVYYDDVIGNGVCQIASTMYNTVLLGGLEVVERHQHQKHMPYVPSGLDATVVSSGRYNALDFKFKNTYKYPIYISAYYGGGMATVEFWSNSNAKEGKEYKTSSNSLGGNTYQSYLHTYQDGKLINTKPIARSRYVDY